MRDEAKIALTLMKFKGLDIHLIREYSYYYWSFCVVKMIMGSQVDTSGDNQNAMR